MLNKSNNKSFSMTDDEKVELFPMIKKGMKKHNCANFSHYIKTLIRKDNEKK